MGIYKNDYKKEEDESLWEIHEIRNKLIKDLKSKTADEINKSAFEKLEKWKKERKKIHA